MKEFTFKNATVRIYGKEPDNIKEITTQFLKKAERNKKKKDEK